MSQACDSKKRYPNQYDKAHEPPPKPEYVSVVASKMDVPGVQVVGPLNDKLCDAYNGLIAVVRLINAMRSAFFIVSSFFVGDGKIASTEKGTNVSILFRSPT